MEGQSKVTNEGSVALTCFFVHPPQPQFLRRRYFGQNFYDETVETIKKRFGAVPGAGIVPLTTCVRGGSDSNELPEQIILHLICAVIKTTVD